MFWSVLPAMGDEPHRLPPLSMDEWLNKEEFFDAPQKKGKKQKRYLTCFLGGEIDVRKLDPDTGRVLR